MNPRILVFAVLAGALGACSHEATQPRSVGVANVQPDANDASVARIAEARCDHEAACGQIGQDQRFASRDACINDTMTSERAGLNQSSCPRGIDADQFHECVSELKEYSCLRRIETLDSLVSCQTSLLCAR